MRGAALALMACLTAAPAAAGLTRAELEAVGAEAAAGAAVPASLGLSDGRRPSVLVLADYDCAELCDPLLARVAAVLERTGLAPGADYRLAVASIDPRDGADAREVFLDAAVGQGAQRAAVLAPEMAPEALERLTAALGFRFAYDADADRFAHPATAYVLTPEGRVSRVFPPLVAEPADMRRAIVEAGRGAVGGLGERLALICYGFDPVTGRYSLLIERVLSAASLAFAAAVALALGLAFRRERRREGGA